MKLKKIFIIFLTTFLLGISAFVLLFRNGMILDSLNLHFENPFSQPLHVPEEYTQIDLNNNGIADPIDIVQAARKEVEQRTPYKSAYYAGGYPPESEGVCTDVIWRGLLGANINLKDLMDADIDGDTDSYPRVNGNPDPNIDFRRVPNQAVFLEKYAISLTTDLIAGNAENLKEWQPGDIVVFLDGYHHVAIISDKRAKDGTPYVIHNNPPFAAEVKLKSFKTPIAGHYRWKF